MFRRTREDRRTMGMEEGMEKGGLATGYALQIEKLATMGLAPAVNGPVMNTIFSIIATVWSKKNKTRKKQIIFCD